MKQKKQEEIKLLFISLKTRPYKWFSLANTVDDVNIAITQMVKCSQSQGAKRYT